MEQHSGTATTESVIGDNHATQQRGQGERFDIQFNNRMTQYGFSVSLPDFGGGEVVIAGGLRHAAE